MYTITNTDNCHRVSISVSIDSRVGTHPTDLYAIALLTWPPASINRRIKQPKNNNNKQTHLGVNQNRRPMCHAVSGLGSSGEASRADCRGAGPGGDKNCPVTLTMSRSRSCWMNGAEPRGMSTGVFREQRDTATASSDCRNEATRERTCCEIGVFVCPDDNTNAIGIGKGK